jgi:ABC-type Fe3+-hydroxamate transport system substrate-binding protein
MRHVPRRALYAAIAVMALLLAGCGIKGEPTGALDPYPTQAIDAAGQTVALQSAPTRIVSADPGATAILRQLGLGSVLVEAGPATVGTAAADPTTSLVVVPLATDAAALQQLHAATHAPIFRYGADPLASAPTVVMQLGLAVGQGTTASAIAESMTTGFNALTKQLAAASPVPTLIEGAGFTGYGPSSPAGLDVAAAGGQNVIQADQPLDIAGLPALGIAAWVSLQPGGSTLASLQKTPELAAVPAIKEHRVISVPKAGFPIDAKLPAALQRLAYDLHSAPVSTG